MASQVGVVMKETLNAELRWETVITTEHSDECGNMLTDINECKQNDATSRDRQRTTSPPCEEASRSAVQGRSSSGHSH